MHRYVPHWDVLFCFFFLMGVRLELMTRKLDQEQTNTALDKEVKMLT